MLLTRSALVASAIAVASPVLANETVFAFDLSPDQEVLPTVSNARGTGLLTYDSDTMSFDLDLDVDGITTDRLLAVGPNATPVHIHFAPAGQNGPIVVDLGVASSFVDNGYGGMTFSVRGLAIGGTLGAITSDALANEQALFAGDLYVNIHTAQFGAGELRGQIVPAPGALTALGGFSLLAARRRRRA